MKKRFYAISLRLRQTPALMTFALLPFIIAYFAFFPNTNRYSQNLGHAEVSALATQKLCIDSLKTQVIKQIYFSALHNLKDKSARQYLASAMWAQLQKSLRNHGTSSCRYRHPVYDSMFSYKIQEYSLVLLKNDHQLIPFQSLEAHYHVIDLTQMNTDVFRESFTRYPVNYSWHQVGNGIPRFTPGSNDIVIVLHQSNELSSGMKQWLQRCRQTVVVNFGDPHGIPLLNEATGIVQVYGESELRQSYAAQLLMGGIGASGKLISHLNDTLPMGFGLQTQATRLANTQPQNAGMCPEKLQQIDKIVLQAIEKKAMPGAQVFVAKNGMVVYNKSFGHHDYSEHTPVQNHHLYDIASVTKVAATTLAIMKMTENGKIDLNAALEKYFKNTNTTLNPSLSAQKIAPDTIFRANLTAEHWNDMLKLATHTALNDSTLVCGHDCSHCNPKEKTIFNVTVQELLAHQSGLNPYLPIVPYYFYADSYLEIWENDAQRQLYAQFQQESHAMETTQTPDLLLKQTQEVDAPQNQKKVYPFEKAEAFNFYFSRRRIPRVAEKSITEKMFLRNHFMDSLYQAVTNMKVREDNPNTYSCMNMILLQMMADSINQQRLDAFVREQFYQPLGMNHTTYLPLQHFPKSRIAPTEKDYLWREQLIHGTVHDPAAALLGGVSGNAGLFSTASDLGILGQMLLNGGHYGGRQFLEAHTIEQFTASQAHTHRGLGFDKPSNSQNMYMSPSAFGHMGFTGCAFWVDPEHDLVYVFLSNRVHPDASNNLLARERIREKVHQAIYDSITGLP